MDIPTPRGKRIVMTSFVDANLYHDLISGKSVTGILHFFNKTPIDWFSKLQSRVETTTFSLEYVATIINLRSTLRYPGVPVEGPSYMLGNNKTVVDTASHPHGKLQKRHNALSFHETRHAISAGVTRFYHIRARLLDPWVKLRGLLYVVQLNARLVLYDFEHPILVLIHTSDNPANAR